MPKVKAKKETRLIPIRVRMFFGCSLLIFCIAIYQSLLRPKLGVNPPVTTALDIPSVDVSITTGESLSGQRDMVQVDRENTGNNKMDEQETPIIIIEEATTGPQFLHQWYQVFSSKDIVLLKTLMDPVVQKNATIRQFWKSYNITHFIDSIETHHLQPQNITLLSTSPFGVEEYQYNLNYTLLPEYNSQIFKETRTAKIKYTENGPKLASIHCETTRCSHNPFFRPENYGLVK